MWLFTTPDRKRSAIDIIVWWELRRVPFNIVVGGVGIVSLVLFVVMVWSADCVTAGVEPFSVISAPFLLNIAYTAGWVVELLVAQVRPRDARPVGPALFKLGLAFSLLIVVLPTAIAPTFYLRETC